jgi:hypothetical protein
MTKDEAKRSSWIFYEAVIIDFVRLRTARGILSPVP